MRNLRVCYPLLFLPLVSSDSILPHSCFASVGADKHKGTCTHTQTVLHTLWSGVNAGNARTHRIVAVAALGKRNDATPLLVLLPCSEREFFGVLPMGDVALIVPGISVYGFPPSS
ncbi:surface protease GP63 [Trypanosoma cruzi]|nr:surface protease GP63 [Trypanosoma cruzi]